MKKLVSLMLSLVMVCSMSVSVFAIPVVRGFGDVPNTHWAHDSIMEMVEQGIFAGTTAPDANGIALFSPDSTMTRAQFITLISRVCKLSYGEVGAKAEEMASYDLWYEADWHRCVESGFLEELEFGGLAGMVEPITREEMAVLIERVLVYYFHEDIYFTMSLEEIPDNEKIDDDCSISVLVCYEKGILVGVDSVGSFNPKGVLTRAQGATVLYRVLNEEARNIPGMTVRDIPSLNLDLSVPTESSEPCGSSRDMYLDMNDKNNEISVSPIKIYETKDFTYNGEYYVAEEDNHYFIMDIEVYNEDVPTLTLSKYFFKVFPDAFVSKHDTFIAKSKMAVFEKDTIKAGKSTLGFVVFEIPSTCDFIGENSLTFHISNIESGWTSGGGVSIDR